MFAPGPATAPRAKPRRRVVTASTTTSNASAREIPAPPARAPANSSFGFESGLFGVADLDTSSFAESSGLGAIPKLPVAKQPVLESSEMKIQKPIVTEVAKKTRVEPPRKDAPTAAAPPARLPSPFVSNVTEIFWAIFAYVASLLNL
jgi:hypothetical protein